MLVVVGGSRRKVGKTSVVESLIRENEEAGWVAIKISPHRHPATRAGRADTDRYLAVGAREAHLIAAPDIEAAIPQVRSIVARSRNVIIESNRVLDYLEPDLCIFVVERSPQEAKPWLLRHLRRAHLVILRNPACQAGPQPHSSETRYCFS